MNRTQLFEKLRIIVKPYTDNAQAFEALEEDTDFIKDLNIDSANLVDIILDIEEQFNIVIDNADMERMLTIRASLDIIETKLAMQ